MKRILKRLFQANKVIAVNKNRNNNKIRKPLHNKKIIIKKSNDKKLNIRLIISNYYHTY